MHTKSSEDDQGSACCGLLLLAIMALIAAGAYMYNQKAQQEKRNQRRKSRSCQKRQRKHSSKRVPIIELPPAQVIQEPLTPDGPPPELPKEVVAPLTQEEVDALPQEEQQRYLDCWTDVNQGVSFDERVRSPVKALNRSLQVEPGVMRDEFVALWYKHGEPVSGAVWPDAQGLVAGSFVSHGAEHTENIGSLQALSYDPATAPYKLSWQPYSVATTKGSGWYAVRVKDTAPCVIPLDSGCERLGKVQLSEEKASVGIKGKEVEFTGPSVQKMMVLCRDSPVPGAKYDLEDAKQAILSTANSATLATADNATEP